MSVEYASCIKCFIIICNIPVLAVGAAAIGLGIWVLLENASVLELSSLKELSIMDQSYLLTSIYLVITAGAAILVFGIVGIVAANSQSACCLGFYAAVLSLILCVEVAGCTLGIVFKNAWDKHLDDAIYRNIRTEYDGAADTQDYFSRHMNSVQTSLSCCGYGNNTDFKQSNVWNRTLEDGGTAEVPISCCLPQSNSSLPSVHGKMDCRKSPDATNSFENPCKPRLEEIYRRFEIIIIASTGSLAFCQLIMLVLVLTMMCLLMKNETYYDVKQSMAN
ncbi:tetraspanin-1-like [Ostrea edulis]|uniref:tetraspanin-1-like n=1 Tax=Ostrea edulis TaxID=37623 RepID=UPI0020951828|nr:tetraspanin-1-like [Ostrea edulis]